MQMQCKSDRKSITSQPYTSHGALAEILCGFWSNWASDGMDGNTLHFLVRAKMARASIFPQQCARHPAHVYTFRAHICVRSDFLSGQRPEKHE